MSDLAGGGQQQRDGSRQRSSSPTKFAVELRILNDFLASKCLPSLGNCATLFVVLWLVIKWRGQELSSQRIMAVRLEGYEDRLRIVELLFRKSLNELMQALLSGHATRS